MTLVFFDELPAAPPWMMPMFRYKRLVIDREAARKAAAQDELDRLDALSETDRVWLTAAGCDIQRLRWDCWSELMTETCYR